MLLYIVKLADLFDGLRGNGGTGGLGFFVELAAHMHHAGLFVGFVLSEQSIEARKPVGMYGAGMA